MGAAEAVSAGLAKDGGLYMPASIPSFTLTEIKSMSGLHYYQLAATLLKPFFGSMSNKNQLEEICSDVFNFDVPLRLFSDKLGILELFHGPTMAFKDFGARFLAKLLGVIATSKGTEITILVATSGDTGGAVANGFYGVKGVKVVVLFPGGKISPFQEQQITGLGGNIRAISVKGTFDHCQMLVKKAFNDHGLKKTMTITSANSINIGRWIPQMVYYFYGWLRWVESGSTKHPVYSVPSGNYGNLAAGLLAARMGLPVDHFIAASNRNNTVPEYLRTGIYTPRESIHTVANAMDVGNPSNFARLTSLVKHGQSLNKLITGFEFTDSEIIGKIEEFYTREKYIADPHTATGILAIEKYGKPGIVTGTADPCKFTEVLPPGIRQQITIPESINKGAPPSISTGMEPEYDNLREYLLNL